MLFVVVEAHIVRTVEPPLGMGHHEEWEKNARRKHTKQTNKQSFHTFTSFVVREWFLARSVQLRREQETREEQQAPATHGDGAFVVIVVIGGVVLLHSAPSGSVGIGSFGIDITTAAQCM